MSIGPMKYVGGVEEITLSPATGSETVNSYGTMYALINKDLRIAELIWRGNATTPTAGTYSFTLPNDYTPKRAALVPLRANGYMEVRTDGKVNLVMTSTTSTYSGAALMYFLAD